MRIEMTTALTAQQKREEAALLAKVHAHDHTFKDIYLSNQLNTEKGMGTFFLAYRDAQLVGFLMNYADGPATEAAELSVIVDPDHRRQGIATALIAAVRAELAKFGYTMFEFVSERAFIEANPDFLTRTHLTIEDGTEFQLGCTGTTNIDFVLPDAYTLRLMTATDLPTLVAQQVEAFDDTDAASATRYLQASLDDPNIRQYVLTDAAGTLLGSTAVDMSDKYYFYGLSVAQPMRGRGFGTLMVRAIMADLAHRQPRRMQLAVESDNPVARHVYAKAGFAAETEILYLQPVVQ
jgi:ribosomal protein S18 acetylase RimI-like enzyme